MALPVGDAGTRWVRNEQELSAFRTHELTAEHVFVHLETHSASLLNLDIGVGKTALIDAMIKTIRTAAPGAHQYDLVVYLASEHSVLAERACLRGVTAASNDGLDADVALLRGRPRQRCAALDADWHLHERAGCAALGRSRICSACPERESCPWPEQFTAEALQGKRVVCATQAYLAANPAFIPLLASRVGATRVLVILDESPLVEAPFRTRLNYSILRRSLDVMASVRGQADDDDATLLAWRRAHAMLLDPHTNLDEFAAPPPLGKELAERIQAVGLRWFGRTFQYLGHELGTLARSARWRDPGGEGIDYIRRPVFGEAHILIAAAGVSLEVARHHFDMPHLGEIFPGVRFLHADTEIVNLKSRVGAACNFEKNSPQILFAAAELIVQRAASDKRSLVVVKKKFRAQVTRALETYLRQISGAPWRVIADAAGDDLADSLVVPLLSYGVRGVNRYEGIETAIALCTYNARPEVLEDHLNDPHPPDAHVRLRVVTDGGQRLARTPGHWDQRAGYDDLAGEYQHLLEAAWAEQALGRVRFTTRPRLVVFFQMGPLRFPAREFTSLQQFRRHFGLSTERTWTRQRSAAVVQSMSAAGLSARVISAKTGWSVRTIRRHRRTQG